MAHGTARAGLVAARGLPATRPCANRDHWLVFHGGGTGVVTPAGAEGVPCGTTRDGRLDLLDLLAACRARGIHAVMVEGGPRLAASFLAARLVDRWVQYLAPTVLGDGPAWGPAAASTAASDASISPAPVLGWARTCGSIWDRRDFAATAAA